MGAKSRREGIQFETIFEKEARKQRIHVIKMPLGCKRVGGPFRNGSRLFQIKTPFDYTLVFRGLCAFIDCKSFDSDRINYSQLTTHQIEALSRINEEGCHAGYLIWFRVPNSIVYFPGVQLAKLQSGESLHADAGEYLGKMDNFALGNLFT